MPPEARGAPLAEVTRAYQFSAAHRMHNPAFSAAENARLYGRCNHPTGHGHTYRLAVTVRGPISPDTGWVLRAEELDALVGQHVLARFDRANLDQLIRPADGVTSTTEVLAGVLWRLLDGALPAGLLWRLRIEETPNNFFEVNRPLLQRAADPPDRPGPAAGTQKASRP
jgi:6-pyruvoyltetrahydropterin/6-carboxytetrahydropterin synthase